MDFRTIFSALINSKVLFCMTRFFSTMLDKFLFMPIDPEKGALKNKEGK
jgi:hypothetical protein